MRALSRIIKRLLVWYFDFMPLPGSFKKLTKSQVLPIIITQSSSIIVEAALTSFAKRSGCHFGGMRTLNQYTPRQDTIFAANMHDREAVQKLIDLREEKLLWFSTFNMFRGKGPMKSHPSYTMKFLDYFSLLFGPLLQCRFLLIIFGEPVQVPDLEHLSVHKLTRRFKLDFYSNLKMVRGTPFQKFSIQEKIVLGGKDYERSLARLSKSMDIPVKKLHEQTKKAFRKIAARPRAWFFIPAAVIAKFILRNLFTDVQVRGLQTLERALKKDTVILVPMHRSHFDYVLIGSVLYEANLNPPLTAAGINLSFWPAGTIIRTLGGYFVKRSARTDRIHGLVLKRYVNYLVKRGHLQEFFIEGGRSRSGRMRPPKLGLLKTMISAYLRKDRKDVLFVPVSISYEHVIEDSEYAKENTGKNKTKESLFSLFRARGMLRQKYKEVIIHFGDPLRFSDFKKEHDKKKQSSLLVEDLGHEIIRRIEGYTTIGFRSLTCLALFLTHRYGMERQKLSVMLRNLVRAIDWYREMEGAEDYALPTPALQRYIDSVDESSHDFHSAGVISRGNYLGGELLYIPGNIRYTAEFYKNSVYHAFVPLGFFSIAAVMNKSVTPASVRPWYDLLQEELLLPKWEEYKVKLQQYHQILLRENILNADEEDNFIFSEQGTAYCIPGLLFPLFESALWVTRCLESAPFIERPHPHDPTRKRRVYEYAPFIRMIQQQLRLAKYTGEFLRTEVSSLSVLTSTLEGLQARGIISFQERFGKRSTLILEHPIEDQHSLLLHTHEKLSEAMERFPEIQSMVNTKADAKEDQPLVQ